MVTLTEGTTADGVHILIRNGEVYIDGQQVAVQRINRYRDGGSTEYVTDKGTLMLPHRIGNPDHTPEWKPA